MTELGHYLVVSGLLFAVGLLGVISRRNVIIVLMAIELMFNAVNLSLVAFSRYLLDSTGQVVVFFSMTVAAAEVGIGLAIVVNLYRIRKNVDTDGLRTMKL
jgi:NADH-quinone oxidoreductase subunit K